MHTTKIKKWGNSYAIRLPKELVKKYHLDADKNVSLREENGHLHVDFQEPETLEFLLAKVTPKNIHEETDWGAPAGKEVW